MTGSIERVSERLSVSDERAQNIVSHDGFARADLTPISRAVLAMTL